MYQIDALERRLLLSNAAPSALLSESAAATPAFINLGPVSTAIAPGASSANPSDVNEADNPSQIRQAYGVNSISFGGTAGDGTGQTIAIVEAYNDPNIISDANAFSSNFGLSQFNGSGEPTLAVLNQTGGTSLTGVPNAAPGDWDVDESLDVEYAHTIAPKANIILFEANSNSNSDLYAAVATAADYPGVDVVSMSWGMREFSGEQSNDSLFTTPSGHQGVTFLACTGNDNDFSFYPSTSVNVIAVGGTDLYVNGDGSYNSETASLDSDGGVSFYEPQPAYQIGNVNGASTTNRATADVSMYGDLNYGVEVLDTYDSDG